MYVHTYSKLSKDVNSKRCSPRLIFLKENQFRKDSIDFGMPTLKFESWTDHWVEEISQPGVNDSRQVEQAIFIILILESQKSSLFLAVEPKLKVSMVKRSNTTEELALSRVFPFTLEILSITVFDTSRKAWN